MIHSQKLSTENLPLIVNWFKQSSDWIREEGLLKNEIDLNKLTVWISLYESLKGEWLIWYDETLLVGFSYHIQRAPSNNRPWIGMVMVAPEKRNNGYGIRIVKGLSDQLLKQGVSIIYGGCPFERIGWLSFLGKCGFEQIGIEEPQSGRRYIKVAKPLE